MDEALLVQLAMDALGCNQKTLAARLNVSPAQVSKWKKGERLSFEMDQRLRELSGIGNRVPEFVHMAGSLADTEKWERLLSELAELAEDNAETGYYTPPLTDEPDLLYWGTFRVLHKMGVIIPKPFPSELDVEYDEDNAWETTLEHELVSVIYGIYKSLTDVYGFYSAYVEELIFDDELDLYSTEAGAIDSHLLELAASKLLEPPYFAKDFKRFRYQTERNYRKWLNLIKKKAFQAGKPLRAELLDMVNKSHDALGHSAEAESLGFNADRVHPDIYMNELLCGMRAIHQVLPAILKKLDIYDEFVLDESRLRA